MARSSKSAIAKEALKDPTTRGYILTKMGFLLQKELMVLYSHKKRSMFHSLPLEEFTWKLFINSASSLYSLLLSCTQTQKPRQNCDSIIGVCCAVLMKFRYSKVCIFQKLISLILYAGRSRKMARNAKTNL